MTDKQVENLIKPLIKRQRLAELDTIRRFGEVIKEIGEAEPRDSASLFKMHESKIKGRDLQRHIEDLIALQLLEVSVILSLTAEDIYANSRDLYEYKKLPFLEYQNNTGIKSVVSKTTKNVLDLFNKIFAFPGFIIRDLRNPENLVPMTISDTYNTLVDECLQTVQNPKLDYDTVMRRTENQLIDSGLNSIYYDSDGKVHVQDLESAVKNNILDGVKLVEQDVSDEIGRQVGSDGVELSAHQFSAPDHEPFQGHQFTNENWERIQSSQDFEDINGQSFAGVERIIGVWNCRHYAWPIIIGETKPRYTQSQLDSFIEQNNIGYDLPNGKHLTMYECTQRQRRYENQIRDDKMGLYFAKTVGDKQLQEKYKAKIANHTDLYTAFSEDCGLPIMRENIEIVTK